MREVPFFFLARLWPFPVAKAFPITIFSKDETSLVYSDLFDFRRSRGESIGLL